MPAIRPYASAVTQALRPFAKRASISVLLALATPAVCRAEGDIDASHRDQARASYEHALQLYDKKEYRAALAEFELARRLAPSFKLYYNIALANLALDDSAAALRAFERYLQLAGDGIPAERVAQVEPQISELRSKVATLRVETPAGAALVLVDGAEVGPSPLRGFYLNVGHHEVEVRTADGRRSSAQALELGAGAQASLHFEVEAPRARAAHRPSAAPEPTLPWPAYGVTAALTGAFAVTGVLALAARAEERDAQHRLTSESELADARQKVNHLALTTDVLLGASLVSAGVATYLTLKQRDPQQPRLGLAVSPMRLGAFVRF